MKIRDKVYIWMIGFWILTFQLLQTDVNFSAQLFMSLLYFFFVLVPWIVLGDDE